MYSSRMTSDGVLRIGELSKRAGVSPELLRAWERRYGLLRPSRSSGGLRLYSPADVERVRLMRQHLAEGVAAAEAAAMALRGGVGEEAAPAALDPAAMRDDLAGALDRFDEPRAQEILDRLLAMATVDTLLSDVVLPYLRELGDRWERGEASIAQEHFASSVLRGRLLGLARGWGLGFGPVAVLACLPGEQHDLGLIAFGLALRDGGRRRRLEVWRGRPSAGLSRSTSSCPRGSNWVHRSAPEAAAKQAGSRRCRHACRTGCIATCHRAWNGSAYPSRS
jgi:DNA-binding transcriptional MerR regulator